MRRTTDAAGVSTRRHAREWDAVFRHESKKPLNNSWQQGEMDNILRSYHTFTKYPKGSFSRASFNKAEPLLQSLHRQSTCKKSLNVLHWANPRAVPAVYLIPFVWWNKGTRQTGESGGYVTSWGGSRSLVMDPSRLKMVNIRVNLFGRCAAGMWEEVTLGHSQRTIISYLETLSVTKLDGQEPALTQTECVSFNRHAFLHVTSLCLPSLQNIWLFHSLKIQKSITYGSILSVQSYCNVKYTYTCGFYILY